MVAIEDNKMKDAIASDIASLKVKFKDAGVSIFVMPLKEML